MGLKLCKARVRGLRDLGLGFQTSPTPNIEISKSSPLYEPSSKLLEGGNIGDYKGDCYRGY